MESSGVVKIEKDLTKSIENVDVLIVEDIIDTGLTMEYLIRNFETRHPASLKICTFLERRINRKIELKIDYRGFLVEDPHFLVGYGLDYAGYYRNVKGVSYFKNNLPKEVF